MLNLFDEIRYMKNNNTKNKTISSVDYSTDTVIGPNISNVNSKFDVYKKCLEMKNYNIYNDFTFDTGIGRDYVICLKNKYPYVAKITEDTINRQIRNYNIQTELKVLNKLQESSIIPKIYDYWKCRINNIKYHVLVFSYIDGTLYDLLHMKIKKDKLFYKNINSNKLIESVKTIRNNLLKNNIIYKDWNLKNLFIKIKDNYVKLLIIDFGLSNISNSKSELAIDQIMYERLIGIDKTDRENIPDLVDKIRKNMGLNVVHKRSMFRDFEYIEDENEIKKRITKFFF